MEDRFEAAFVLDITPGAAWAALEAYQEARPSAESPARYTQWALPAFPVGTGEVLESVTGKLLRMRKDTMPCEGTEILIQFEAVESGTRVTVVQSGFGAAFATALREILEVGARHIFADLALYLERGIDAQRHQERWGSLGAITRSTPLGQEIVRVSGGIAQHLGLQPGDVLLTIGGAPIVSQLELQTALRFLVPGSETSVSWVRGRVRMSAATMP